MQPVKIEIFGTTIINKPTKSPKKVGKIHQIYLVEALWRLAKYPLAKCYILYLSRTEAAH